MPLESNRKTATFSINDVRSIGYVRGKLWILISTSKDAQKSIPGGLQISMWKEKIIKLLKDNIGEYLELEFNKDVLNKTWKNWDGRSPTVQLVQNKGHPTNHIPPLSPVSYRSTALAPFLQLRTFRLTHFRGKGISHDALHGKHLHVCYSDRGGDSGVIFSDCLLCARHCAKHFAIVSSFICISASGWCLRVGHHGNYNTRKSIFQFLSTPLSFNIWTF